MAVVGRGGAVPGAGFRRSRVRLELPYRETGGSPCASPRCGYSITTSSNYETFLSDGKKSFCLSIYQLSSPGIETGEWFSFVYLCSSTFSTTSVDSRGEFLGSWVLRYSFITPRHPARLPHPSRLSRAKQPCLPLQLLIHARLWSARFGRCLHTPPLFARMKSPTRSSIKPQTFPSQNLFPQFTPPHLNQSSTCHISGWIRSITRISWRSPFPSAR